jgi:hypothetical protein
MYIVIISRINVDNTRDILIEDEFDTFKISKRVYDNAVKRFKEALHDKGDWTNLMLEIYGYKWLENKLGKSIQIDMLKIAEDSDFLESIYSAKFEREG